MSNALSFNDVTMTPVMHNQQTYLTSVDLASALGYKDSRSVTKLYNANSDEFTDEMTRVVESGTRGKIGAQRIFSLRGAHLIAMFSRTAVAKAFRKWVLDILDKEVGQPVAHIECLIPSEQQTLRELVAEKAKATLEPAKAYPQIYARLQNKFRVARYDQLPRTRLAEALSYIMQMELKGLGFGSNQPYEKISNAQQLEIKRAVNTAFSAYLFRDSEPQHFYNYLRVRYNIHSVADLPEQHFSEMLALIEELKGMNMRFIQEINNIRNQYASEVIGHGAPWTADLKRKWNKRIQEALPERPDWSKVAKKLH